MVSVMVMVYFIVGYWNFPHRVYVACVMGKVTSRSVVRLALLEPYVSLRVNIPKSNCKFPQINSIIDWLPKSNCKFLG